MESREFKLILIACLVAWALSGIIGLETRASDRQESDMLVRFFGGTAEIASQSALDQADLYLHAGTARECPDEHEHQAEHVDTLPLQGLVRKLHGQTAPTEHKHIKGAEDKELLPWFVIAARLNRHNVEAWLDGTYWFYRTGQSNRAERFINEAIEYNPTDHRVYLERGVLYHRLKRYDEAASDLENAIKFYKRLSDESPYELKAARIYLRDSRERVDSKQ